MAISHGGANGVHEAFYNEVPVIIVPQLVISLCLLAVSQSQVNVDDEVYVKNIQRLKKNFVQAGGVERAADLVEHYKDVGYSHLVPAYAKYDCNLIQYYNVDVCLLLGTLLGLVLYTRFWCCKCICTNGAVLTLKVRRRQTENFDSY